jgi:NADH:ubiquinone oxidoreductase subunit 4 (subunit M)
MYGKKPKEEGRIKEPKMLLIPIFILVAAIIVLGLYPTIVFNLIEPATLQLPFIP